MNATGVRQKCFQESSNAPKRNHHERTFRVTHPYHPLLGQKFQLITYRNHWGEDRVYFHDDKGDLCILPASWTDIGPEDPFVTMSQGRSYFRFEDLLSLTQLVKNLQEKKR